MIFHRLLCPSPLSCFHLEDSCTALQRGDCFVRQPGGQRQGHPLFVTVAHYSVKATPLRCRHSLLRNVLEHFYSQISRNALNEVFCPSCRLHFLLPLLQVKWKVCTKINICIFISNNKSSCEFDRPCKILHSTFDENGRSDVISSHERNDSKKRRCMCIPSRNTRSLIITEVNFKKATFLHVHKKMALL